MSQITPATEHELRTIALDAIVVRDGFNPRSRFDAADVSRMAVTMRRSGVLQPLLVRPAEIEGRFELVDGERRYRAAREAELAEVPVLVTSCAPEADGADLVSALTANFQRVGHTPVEEAHAFARLLEAGLTRKGICELLQVSRELVRDRLEILQLPEELHASIDDGTIPLGAIKALVALGKIHAELPACALRAVLADPEDAWRRSVSWGDVIADPIDAITTNYTDEEPLLPNGVFESFTRYPLSAFTLDDRAEKALAGLAKLQPSWANRDVIEMSFDQELLEVATALGATHQSRDGHSELIVGQDVADQLVSDRILAQLKIERARARQQHADAAGKAAAADTSAPLPESPEQATERRRAERAAEMERRARAQAFNLGLGVAVLKAFGKVRVDARVLRVLSAIDFTNELAELASRGARYGFPGWPTEETTPGGKTKVVYLERYELARKAHEFLAGAETAAEIAGRCVALAVMAVMADEECVARSNRSMVSLHAYRPSTYTVPGSENSGLPWARSVVEILEELAIERLPEHITAALRDRREQERVQAEQQADQDRAAEHADGELRERLGEMTADERLEALRAFTAEHGRASERAYHLREHVLGLNASEPSQAAETTADDATQSASADAGSTPSD